MGKTFKIVYYSLVFILLAVILSLFIVRPFLLAEAKYDKFSMNVAKEIKVDAAHDNALYLDAEGELPGPDPARSYVFAHFESNGRKILPYKTEGYKYNTEVKDKYYYWLNDEDLKSKDTAKFSAVYYTKFKFKFKFAVLEDEVTKVALEEHFDLDNYSNGFYTYEDSNLLFQNYPIAYVDPTWTAPKKCSVKFYLDDAYKKEVLSFGELIANNMPKTIYLRAEIQ